MLLRLLITGYSFCICSVWCSVRVCNFLSHYLAYFSGSWASPQSLTSAQCTLSNHVSIAEHTPEKARVLWDGLVLMWIVLNGFLSSTSDIMGGNPDELVSCWPHLDIVIRCLVSGQWRNLATNNLCSGVKWNFMTDSLFWLLKALGRG